MLKFPAMVSGIKELRSNLNYQLVNEVLYFLSNQSLNLGKTSTLFYIRILISTTNTLGCVVHLH